MEIRKAPLYLPTTTPDRDFRFEKVLQSCFPSGHSQLKFEETTAPYWDSAAFGLDRVAAYRALPAASQLAILKRCTEDLLRESCFIEMAGLSYTARMSLESHRLEERMFYAMMASEEATHFNLLRPFVSDETLALGPDGFTALIGEMIEQAERERVIFLMQVLLEGWGLTHFSWLGSHCRNESLRTVFKTILKDEARHHAAGLALCKDAVTKGDKKVISWLEEILAMVRIGPARLMAALGEHVDLTRTAPQVLSELDAHASTRERLLRLRGLLSPHVDPGVLSRLEEKKLFEPGF